MKKYKEWLTNEIEIMESETSENYPHEQMVEREVVLNLINQLDEPEVLSQKWIDENSTNLPMSSPMARWVSASKLQNLLVPKQEELESAIKVLIEAYKQEENAHSELENGWISGFIKDLKNLLEEEQKYYVMNNHNRVMLGRMMDGKTITEADPFKLEDMYEGEKKSHRLTEQEIKDYDFRYWAFAVKVEELED